MTAGLRLIGIGPGGLEGATIAALNAAKTSDYRMYEAYTALWTESEISRLEDEVGSIERIMRPQVENPVEILELARKSVVAILIVGDPLQATTHVDIQLRAEKLGIDCEIIHGVSITTIVTGAIGLSNYKFGRQTTIAYPYENWIATSPLEVIAVNRYQGLHTLVLLDLDPTGEGAGMQKPMQPKDIFKSMQLMVNKLENYMSESSDASEEDDLKMSAYQEFCNNVESLDIVLCTDMGTTGQQITYVNFSDLPQASEGGMHCLVIPGKLNEIEIEALSRWTKK
tara:strand:- start:1523 stop:2371 length:849 start_codon:yes stop_codon:yes gene_type:complete